MLCLKRGAGGGASPLHPMALHVSVVLREGPPGADPAPRRPSAAALAALAARKPTAGYFSAVAAQPDGSVRLTRDWRAAGSTAVLNVPVPIMRHLGIASTIVRTRRPAAL